MELNQNNNDEFNNEDEFNFRKSSKKSLDVNVDGWLVSYADMMTLIACFFILMMAFANYDPVGFNKKAKELSKNFNKGKYKPSENKLTTLTEEIAKHPDILKKTKITVNEASIIISFSGSVLFREAQDKLNPETMSSLDLLIDLIRGRDPNFKVIIEGHTDPFEANKNELYNTSWELSAIRAARVLERFEQLGFNSKKLVAIAKGDSELVEEATDNNGNPIPQNNISNRRVLIKVLEPVEVKQKIKFGFGIYFND